MIFFPTQQKFPSKVEKRFAFRERRKMTLQKSHTKKSYRKEWRKKTRKIGWVKNHFHNNYSSRIENYLSLIIICNCKFQSVDRSWRNIFVVLLIISEIPWANFFSFRSKYGFHTHSHKKNQTFLHFFRFIFYDLVFFSNDFLRKKIDLFPVYKKVHYFIYFS